MMVWPSMGEPTGTPPVPPGSPPGPGGPGGSAKTTPAYKGKLMKIVQKIFFIKGQISC